MQQDIQKLWALIEKADRILLINHIRMDPDAFGSIAAFYEIMIAHGKDVKATNDDQAPESFWFLWKNHIIEPSMDIASYDPDLIISFDAGWLSQLWNSYTNYQQVFEKKDFVVLDHHMTNPGFGKINIIDIESSSTCELLYRIIKLLWFEQYMTPEIATLLTAGMLTDTNMYYNTNTTARTMRTGAELIEHGADFRLPMFEFFKKKTLSRSRAWWEVLKDIKSSDDGKIVWAAVKPEILENIWWDDSHLKGLINEFLANIEWSEVCFLLYPLADGTTKASMRSKPNISVWDLCAEFGWGWHKQAAGFTSKKSIDEVEKDILERLRNI